VNDDVVDAAVLEFRVRGDQAISTFGQIEQAAGRMERAATRSAERAAEKVGGIGKNAGANAAAVEAASRRYTQSIEREIASLTLSRTELRKWEAQMKGIPESVYAPLIRRHEEATAARDAETAAMRRQEGAASSLLNSLRGAQGLLAGAGISVGAAAFVELGKSILDTRIKAESLQLVFQAGLGANASREFEAVRDTAQRLGLEFQSTASSYAKFAAAARGTALEGEGVRRVFESVARASVVFGLSAEQSEGALTALQQMVSKGTVSAEELRGQLGERLPGAFQVAARSIGVTTAELSRLLEQGLVPATEFLPKFAAQLDREVGGAAESAANRTAASMNRLVNAIEEAKRISAQGATGALVQGALDAAAKGLDAMSAAMKRAQAEGGGLYAQITAGQVALLGFGKSAATAAADLTKAEAELARLQAGMRANPGDIILGQYTREAEQLVVTLRAAKAAQDALAAPDPRDRSGFKSRGQSYADFETAQARATGLLTEARNKALGVDSNWLKTLMELNAERERGFISEKEYTATAQQLTADAYKKTGAHKASADAFAAERDAAKSWAQVLKKAADIQAEAEGKTLGLSRAQAELVDYLSSPAYATNAEEMRQMAVAALVAANNAEMLGEAQRRTAALTAEAGGHYSKYLDELRRGSASVLDQIAAMEDQNRAAQIAAAANITLAEAIEMVTIARLREKQAAMDIPDAAAYDAIQREIDARERLLGLIRSKAATDANAEAARQQADAWSAIASDAGQALTDALFNGGKDAGEMLKGYFKSLILRPVIQAAVQPFVNTIVQALGAGGAAGGGGTNWLSMAGAAGQMGGGWGNIASSIGSYLGIGSGATAGGAIAGSSYGAAVNAALAEYGITSGATATAGTTAAAGSSAAGAIPIIGWIIAAIMASKGAYEAGNTLSMLDGKTDYGVGKFEADKYDTLTSLGVSEEWAQILSGAPLTARLFGSKASASGFGIGTVQDGNFIQGTSAPIKFGANTLGTGADEFLQDLSSRLAGGVALSASLFGGGLTNGLRVGAVTDRDRDNEVASLLGFFGADDKLIAGVQTGSGAFGEGGPGRAAGKIAAGDLENWIAEQMPVLMIQGLQQSDLADRFDTYFDSVSAAKLDPKLASQMLQTATAVQQLTDAFTPLGGAFSQFEGLSVAAFEQLAKTAGGFDALGQSVGTYYQAFYSEAERTEDAMAGITKTLKDAGIETIPTTREGFRALVDSLDDLSTEADQKAFAALMKVAGAFDAVTQASDNLTAGLDAAIARALPKFQTPAEQQQSAFATIAGDLKSAGLSFSVEALLAASKDEIYAFAESFVGLASNSTEAKTAVVNAAAALAGLKDDAGEAAAGALSRTADLQIELLEAQGRGIEALNLRRQAELASLAALEATLGVAAGSFTKLQQEIYAATDATSALVKRAELMAGLDGVVADFLAPKDLAFFRAQRVQQTLATGGINASVENILGADRADILELWHAVGDEGKQAIIDAYASWKVIYDDQTKTQRDALTSQIDGLKRIRDLADDIAGFTKTLRFGDLSPLSAEAQLAEAQSLFNTTLAKAQGGDATAAGQLQSVATALLEEASGAFASGPAYTAIFSSVTDALDQFGGFAGGLDPAIEAAEAQLAALDSLGGMLGKDGDIYAVLADIKTIVGGQDGNAPTDRTFVSGPTGSSGGLSAGVVDIAPRRIDTTATDKQNELLEKVLVKLDKLDKLEVVATAANANAVVDQEGFRRTAEALQALSTKFAAIENEARMGNARARAYPMKG
jgi:tape measure domain-containing protein